MNGLQGCAFLGWRAQDIARQSAVGIATVRRAELADEAASLTAADGLCIRRALEAAGVEFIDENGGGPGVRFAIVKAAESVPAEPCSNHS